MQEVLHAPDSALGGWWWGCGPWGELFGDGAEVRPAACAGFCGCFCGYGAVVGDFGWGEEVGDYDEAVALEGVEVGCGHGGDGDLEGLKIKVMSLSFKLKFRLKLKMKLKLKLSLEGLIWRSGCLSIDCGVLDATYYSDFAMFQYFFFFRFYPTFINATVDPQS